jgi:hypothetical protein
MLDTLIDHRSQFLAGLGEKLGKASSQRQSPDRGEVSGGGPREFKAISRRCRGRPLVRQDSPSLRVYDLKPAEYTGYVASYAGRIGETHPVDGEAWRGVPGKDSVVQPSLHDLGCDLIAIFATPWYIDAHNVVW